MGEFPPFLKGGKGGFGEGFPNVPSPNTEMKRLFSIIIAASILSFYGCLSEKSWRDVFVDSAEVDKTLMNYALPENGGKLFVSKDNPKHPASTLNNRNTHSEDWDAGEGWESVFDEAYWYGRYFGYGLYDNIFGSEDYKWRGLRDFRYIQSAMGWVIIEFPSEKLINRVDVYTIDSKKYPAKKYGVNHLMLQYWTPQAKGWQVVQRFGKGKGQQFDSIRDINTGKVVFRFKPVKTSKVRLAVLWTNDAEKEPGNWPKYAEGTIRLIELEVYGFEKMKGEIPVSKAEVTKPEELFLTEETSNGQSAAIETIVRNYEQAYRDKDIAEFMKNISPDYNRRGETYQELEAKMSELFKKYENINFSLGKLKISQNVQKATAEAKYSLRLEKTGGESSSYAGKLIFKLSISDGDWRIFCVESK